ncbi:hypothetical protein HPB47_009303, partial [Ixodes persulcatus]
RTPTRGNRRTAGEKHVSDGYGADYQCGRSSESSFLRVRMPLLRRLLLDDGVGHNRKWSAFERADQRVKGNRRVSRPGFFKASTWPDLRLPRSLHSSWKRVHVLRSKRQDHSGPVYSNTPHQTPTPCQCHRRPTGFKLNPGFSDADAMPTPPPTNRLQAEPWVFRGWTVLIQQFFRLK